MPENSQEKADKDQQLKNHNPNQQHNSTTAKKQPLAPIPNDRSEPDAERQSTGPQRSPKEKSERPDTSDP